MFCRDCHDTHTTTTINITATPDLTDQCRVVSSLKIQHVCQGGQLGLRPRLPPFCVKSAGRPKPGGRWGPQYRILQTSFFISTQAEVLGNSNDVWNEYQRGGYFWLKIDQIAFGRISECVLCCETTDTRNAWNLHFVSGYGNIPVWKWRIGLWPVTLTVSSGKSGIVSNVSAHCFHYYQR